MLEVELEAVGIRLNTRPPDVVFKQKTAGGVSSFYYDDLVTAYMVADHRKCLTIFQG